MRGDHDRRLGRPIVGGVGGDDRVERTADAGEKVMPRLTLGPTMSEAQGFALRDKFGPALVDDLDVQPGAKVLDLGCGCGAIAEHMAELTGAELFGINIDRSQIAKAWRNPNLNGANFNVGDFNVPLNFPDESFDAVYAIQPMTYVTNLEATCREVLRVLKPGGRFVVNDVAALDAYDRDNAHQRGLIQDTRELTVFGGFCR